MKALIVCSKCGEHTKWEFNEDDIMFCTECGHVMQDDALIDPVLVD